MAAPPRDHLLSAAARVWKDIGDDLVVDAATLEAAAASASDGVLIEPGELKKVAKWMQHTVTKFGASASVADGAERERSLQPIAEEVIKAFTAAIGTLLSIRRGAGPSLLVDIREAGAGLAAAVDELGATAATEGNEKLGLSSGKVLDRIKHVEKVSTQNRAAIRRRLLRSLAQLRDAHRELREALERADDPDQGGQGGDDEDDDWMSDPDESLEPEERRVIEAIVAISRSLEECLKEVSQACVPGSDIPLANLEMAASSACVVSTAVDGLAAHAQGGLEVEAMRGHVAELQGCLGGLSGSCPGNSASINPAMEQLQAAIDAAVAIA